MEHHLMLFLLVLIFLLQFLQVSSRVLMHLGVFQRLHLLTEPDWSSFLSTDASGLVEERALGARLMGNGLVKLLVRSVPVYEVLGHSSFKAVVIGSMFAAYTGGKRPRGQVCWAGQCALLQGAVAYVCLCGQLSYTDLTCHTILLGPCGVIRATCMIRLEGL